MLLYVLSWHYMDIFSQATEKNISVQVVVSEFFINFVFHEIIVLQFDGHVFATITSVNPILTKVLPV